MSGTPIHLERVEPASVAWARHGFQHLQRYDFALSMVHGKRVLDLACGPGYGAYVLARNGASEVVGVDIAKTAIAHALQTYKAENLSFSQADGQAFRSDRPFDVIVSFETMEHVPDPASLVSSFACNLEKDGLLILSVPNRLKHKGGADPCDNPFHLNEPTYNEAVALLSAHFDILQAWEQSPVNADAAFNVDRLHVLQSSWLLNGVIRLESCIRKWFGKPWPVRQPGTRLDRWSEIMPLLPSRFDVAEVFLFVCRKREQETKRDPVAAG